MPLQTVTRTLAAFFLLLLTLPPGAVSPLPARGGGITVEDYCGLTKSLMELSVKEWEERAQVAAANKGDRKTQAAKLEEVAKEYRPQRGEVYARYGMTPSEDLRFASEHRSEIADYLDEHPEVRDSLDSLKARIDALIEQVESAAPAAPPEGGQQ